MSEKFYKEQVCSRLNIAIQAIGRSKREISEEFSVSQSRLGHWTTGARHYPDMYFLYRFCERFGISADWIIRGRVSAAMSRPLEERLWAATEASPGALVEQQSQARGGNQN